MSSAPGLTLGEASRPGLSPAEQALADSGQLIIDNFLRSMPEAYAAAEQLLGVDSGPITPKEEAQGLTRYRLPTSAFFESYDPVASYVQARSGEMTPDNVQGAVTHSRNTLFIAPGIMRDYPGSGDPEGPPAGIMVVGPDEAAPNRLCTYVYTTAEYLSEQYAPGRTPVLRELLGASGRGYIDDGSRSRLDAWVRSHGVGNLHAVADQLENLLNVEPAEYAARLFASGDGGSTDANLLLAGERAPETPSYAQVVASYLSGLRGLAPDVADGVLAEAAALLADYTPGLEVRQSVTDNGASGRHDPRPSGDHPHAGTTRIGRHRADPTGARAGSAAVSTAVESPS